MKSKLAIRMAAYFTAVLLLFALVVGSIFTTLFQNQTLNIYKENMEQEAWAIADTVSAMSDQMDMGPMGRQGGYGAYLRVLEDMVAGEVWIVDESLSITMNPRKQGQTLMGNNFSADGERMVRQAMEGYSIFSEDFEHLFGVPTLTVGVPLEKNGIIVGALLLHEPMEGGTQGAEYGLRILGISLIAALLLGILMALLLARGFAKPLIDIAEVVQRMKAGEYGAKTGICRKDEIGELAVTIDLLGERLESSKQVQKQLEQLRKDLITNISHELRTPVTVIRGSLEALVDGVVESSEQVKSYHQHMLQDTLYLQRLVDDLLDFTRLQNPGFSLEKKPVHWDDLCHDVVHSAERLGEKKEVGVKYEILSAAPEMAGDYGRLRQLLLILLDNGIKFTPAGGNVGLVLSERQLWVWDEGPGISEENLPYVFDRFYKEKTSQNQQGTGLGLAIAKEIAERHGMELSVENGTERGSQFILTFSGYTSPNKKEP
jgi:signal transduction histidine kinase